MNKRWRAVATALVAALCVSACFLLPGKFVSTLDVRRDGHFSFAYKGEIVVLDLQSISGVPVVEKDDPTAPCFGPVPGAPKPEPQAEAMKDATGSASRTLGPVPSRKPRDCTTAERERRSAAIVQQNATAAANRKQEGERLTKLFGFDPNDEASMTAYAAQLQKQAGWRSVVFRGKGVFDVDFEQSGMLDRDFVFPVFPKAATLLPFVVIRKRADGAVLVTASGFHANPMSAFANGMMGASAAPTPKLSYAPQGSFTITTDTSPLTNNTDDGPSRDGVRTVLHWTIGAANDQVPEALLPLAISR